MRGYAGALVIVLAAGMADAQTPRAVSPCDPAYRAFASSQDIAAAIDGYRACLAEAPGTARYNLGVLYAGTQDWGQAIEQFEAYLTLDATSARAEAVRTELARLAELRARYDTPEKVRQLRHDRLLRQSRLFLEVGMADEAEALAERAVQYSGGTYDDYIALAAAAAARRHFDVAMLRLDQARLLAAAERLPALAALRAGIHRELTIATLRTSAESSLTSDPQRAADLFATAWGLAPERGDLGFAAAIAYAGTDTPQRAIPILDALARSADAELAARGRRLGADLRRLVAAIGTARAKDAQALSDLLAGTGRKRWTDLSSRDLARVEPVLANLVRERASSVSLRHHYAFVLARQRKWPEAEAQYTEILQRDPDAPVRFWLARVLYNEARYEEAQRVLNEDLQRADNGTPASADLKRYLSEDVRDALRRSKR